MQFVKKNEKKRRDRKNFRSRDRRILDKQRTKTKTGKNREDKKEDNLKWLD